MTSDAPPNVSPDRTRPALLDAERGGARTALPGRSGVLPRQQIRTLLARRMLRAREEIEDSQLQPASLDLRLGTVAHRVRASFLPGRDAEGRPRTVRERLDALGADRIDLRGGAVLERGCVYVVELMEHLALPESLSAAANPKSSTGRLDIFTRLITDGAEVFDWVPGGYEGPLYAEISPSSFSVRVRPGSRLNQIRFRSRTASQSELAGIALPDRELRARHEASPLVDRPAVWRNGLVVGVDLSGLGGSVVGYRAQRFADVIDVDRIGAYRAADFWDALPVRTDRQLILDPHQFYILVSRERLRIPSDLAVEMTPTDALIGEFRVHYAGFFDPGFGDDDGRPAARAVLEVRSREVPFLLEDGQAVGRLVYEPLTEAPEVLYGRSGTSNYQNQGLKLSKHFA